MQNSFNSCPPFLLLFFSKNKHPGRLTWNIIIEVWKIIFLSKWVIYMFHVNLPGWKSAPKSDKERGFRANAATPPPRQGPTHLGGSWQMGWGVYPFPRGNPVAIYGCVLRDSWGLYILYIYIYTCIYKYIINISYIYISIYIYMLYL